MLRHYERDHVELREEFRAFEALLRPRTPLSEKNDILPFMRARPHLAASFGLANTYLAEPDRLAQEVDLFGSFRCDIAVGSSREGQFTLIELEDASPRSIFEASPKRTYPRWSTRFERGFSQLVDWAWRLTHERPPSVVLEPIFGCPAPKIHYVLVIGRHHWLGTAGEARLEWRRSNNGISNQRTTVWTYDDFLDFVRRRIESTDRDIARASKPGMTR